MNAGIDIGGTSTKIGIVDDNGRVIARTVVMNSEYPELERYIDAMAAALKEITPEGETLDGVGICAPCANYATGMVDGATNLHWPMPMPLRRLMSEKTGLRVEITNDANAAAMGERKYGAAKGLDNFVVITLGTGVGAGVVCDGHLLTGSHGFAGEFGHVRVFDGEGRMCGCNRPDCLETYCSARGVVENYRQALLREGRKLSKGITPKDIAALAAEGEEAAVEAFAVAGRRLGEAAANFCAFSDPDAFVLFGGVAKAGELIAAPMREALDRTVLHLYRGKVQVLVSQLDEADAALLGASGLIC